MANSLFHVLRHVGGGLTLSVSKKKKCSNIQQNAMFYSTHSQNLVENFFPFPEREKNKYFIFCGHCFTLKLNKQGSSAEAVDSTKRTTTPGG
uniref:Uncharacterized protein n=1 Tax=Mola mola TaxID=94237 RepID=A0A3Q3X2I2_MOLML